MSNCKALANVYIIVYVTVQGKTGHVGFAIDNYSIRTTNNGVDTVADGTLTYYDVWPNNEGFGVLGYSKNYPAKFYKLPDRIWASPITVNSLSKDGIPHREHYPCDAILMFRTTRTLDLQLSAQVDNMVKSNKRFNPRYYNCGDFVVDAIRLVTNQVFRAKEFIPFSFTTTPNKLYRKAIKLKDVIVLKSPNEKVKKRFVRERILKAKHFKTNFQSGEEGVAN